MTFDPFGDFETQGYLRNLAKEKDPEIVRRLEHTAFTTGIDAAFEYLAKVEHLSYPDVIETHRILFDAVCPWAGRDRLKTASDLAISKGNVLFARPEDIRRAVEFALTHGQDKKADDPGEGHLDAYLKPFIREALSDDRLAEEIVQTPGLDGSDEQNEVLGKTSDPALKARYEQQKMKRRH